MLITGLTFQQAIKYAYLGDEIWREWTGRQNALQVDKTMGSLTVLKRFAKSIPVNDLTSDDVLANDWIALTGEISV